MDLSAPVCVVGAGQSGILTAAKLVDLGYRTVDVLEASDVLGGLSETYTVDGAVYDFHAHLIGQQSFGADMSGTPIDELMARHPVAMQPESLFFLSRLDSGEPVMTVPPHFVPLLRSLTPVQAIDQLAETWTIIERALGSRGRPGLAGFALDGPPGETWETFRARHAPLVGEILQGISLYANMRRAGQPAATMIAINAHISGHVSQLAKLLLSAYPADRQAMLDRMPPSLTAQVGSRRPIALGFVDGFVSFLRRVAEDHRLNVRLGSPVLRLDPLPSGEVRVTTAIRSATYSRVVVTGKPSQIRSLFPSGDVAELFSERNCPRTWTRTYLVKVPSETITFPSADGTETLGFWVIDPYGSLTDTDPEQARHRVTAVNKQHPGQHWICFSNSDRTISDARAWEFARESLFVFDSPELVAETIAEWPAYPSAAAVRDGWFDRVDAIQGRDGIHFVGEVLSGPTLECISAYVEDVIPLWF